MNLAQMNIAKAKAPLDSPSMKEFVDNLDYINGLAENSPGYVWRLQDESGDATSIQLFDDPLIIVNMSVWESADSLKHFLFKTDHLTFLKRRDHWFEKMPLASHVMWWIEEHHLPTAREGVEKLKLLQKTGDSKEAFGFRSKVFLEATTVTR